MPYPIFIAMLHS